MGPICGNQGNFKRYLVSDVAERRVSLLRQRGSLVLTGYSDLFAPTT